MKLVSWNVNGLRAVLKNGFLDFIKKEQPDILCLQEVKLGKDDTSILEEYPYQYYNKATKPGYAGTAIFSKIKPLSSSYDDKEVCDSHEGRIVNVEFKDFYLINVYTPNSQRGLTRLEFRQAWDKKFLSYLTKLEQKKPVIFCGDLNVAHTALDLANPKPNYNKNAGYTQIEIDGLTNLLNAGYIDSFREFNKEGGHYTWWSYMFNARQKNIGWRIDYFLISKKLRTRLKNAAILKDVKGSDHCPISITIT
ncbi:MAG: exodeoxyribonuclease III [Candidatus Nanoarchaeia archaeon]